MPRVPANVARDMAVLAETASTAKSCRSAQRARSWWRSVTKETQMPLKARVWYKQLAEPFTFYNLLLGRLVMPREMAFILWLQWLRPLLSYFISLPFLELRLSISCLNFQNDFSSQLLELAVKEWFTLCHLFTLHPLLSDHPVGHLFSNGLPKHFPKSEGGHKHFCASPRGWGKSRKVVEGIHCALICCTLSFQLTTDNPCSLFL